VHGHLERAGERRARCTFTLADLPYRFPHYPLPPDETPIAFLRHLTEEGARGRWGTITPRIRAQLDHELGLIGATGAWRDRRKAPR
jgi:error-prone DNA polymerase